MIRLSILKANFFVKPFLFINPAVKERFWEIELELYMRMAMQNMFPFSFTEYLNLPVYIREKIKEIHNDIIERKTNALRKLQQ